MIISYYVLWGYYIFKFFDWFLYLNRNMENGYDSLFFNFRGKDFIFKYNIRIYIYVF